MQLVSRVLTGQTAVAQYAGISYITGLYIARPLTGTLIIGGFIDNTGTAANWVIPVGSTGVIVSAGKAIVNGLTTTLSSASDNGLALLTLEILI